MALLALLAAGAAAGRNFPDLLVSGRAGAGVFHRHGWRARRCVRGSLMAGLWLLGMLVGPPRRRGVRAGPGGMADFAVRLAQLFAPGFILSFVTAAGLMHRSFLHTVFGRTAGRRCRLTGARKRWRVWMRWYWRARLFSTAASTAAWLAAMPLMACWFNVWSPFPPWPMCRSYRWPAYRRG